MALAVKTDFEVDERARAQRASELRARDYEAWLEDAKEGWRLIAKKRAALRSFVKKENDLDAVAGGGSRGISDAKRARFAALELTNVHALSRDEQKKSKKPKGGLTRWRLAKLDDLVLGEAATLQQAVRALARLRAREAEEEAEGVAPGSLLDEEDRMTRLELFSMGTRAGRREGNVDGDEDDDDEEDELERDDGMRGPGGGGAYGNLGVDDDVNDDDGGGGGGARHDASAELADFARREANNENDDDDDADYDDDDEMDDDDEENDEENDDPAAATATAPATAPAPAPGETAHDALAAYGAGDFSEIAPFDSTWSPRGAVTSPGGNAAAAAAAKTPMSPPSRAAQAAREMGFGDGGAFRSSPRRPNAAAPPPATAAPTVEGIAREEEEARARLDNDRRSAASRASSRVLLRGAGAGSGSARDLAASESMAAGVASAAAGIVTRDTPDLPGRALVVCPTVQVQPTEDPEGGAPRKKRKYVKRQARTVQTTADKEIDAAVELADKPPSTLTVRELAVLLKGAKLLIARRRVLLYNGIDSSSRRAALGFRVVAKKIHKCVACGRVFDVPSRLVDHMNEHTGARPYACPHESCGMTFTNRQALAMHKKSIHDPKEHVCPVPGCGKRFSNSSTLNQHRLAHSDERPHKCEVAGCGKTFKTESALATHGRVHTGEKPFKCEVEGCGKSFGYKLDLQRHTRTHFGQPAKPGASRKRPRGVGGAAQLPPPGHTAAQPGFWNMNSMTWLTGER